MNWHATTEAEANGEGDYRYIIDVSPDIIPHQSGTDGDALIRIGRPGWSWIILDRQPGKKKSPIAAMGHEEHRAAAIAMAVGALGELRS